MRDGPTASDSTDELAPDEQRRAVRRRYGRIASDTAGCCSGSDGSDGNNVSDERDGCSEAATASDSPTETESSGCCDGADTASGEALTRRLGYSDEEASAVAAGANLGLGCGNPNAIASLTPGETVLDLGSGAGFDCFLAAREVEEPGHVIGVDMTPEMVERARENVERNDATNVEFRLGEIEHLPVADGTVDVVISNCVVNLSPDKQQVFHEAFRVLRPGGRLAISDVVLTADVPAAVRADPESVASCIAGAAPTPALRRLLSTAGFEEIRIETDDDSASFISEWDPERDVSEYVVSATIEAVKPT